jgi:hypothetical protein
MHCLLGQSAIELELRIYLHRDRGMKDIPFNGSLTFDCFIVVEHPFGVRFNWLLLPLLQVPKVSSNSTNRQEYTRCAAWSLHIILASNCRLGLFAATAYEPDVKPPPEPQ